MAKAITNNPSRYHEHQYFRPLDEREHARGNARHGVTDHCANCGQPSWTTTTGAAQRAEKEHNHNDHALLQGDCPQDRHPLDGQPTYAFALIAGYNSGTIASSFSATRTGAADAARQNYPTAAWTQVAATTEIDAKTHRALKAAEKV